MSGWTGAPTAEDLRLFFDGDLTMQPYWSALEEYREEYRIGRFDRATASLDDAAKAKFFNENFRDLYPNAFA